MTVLYIGNHTSSSKGYAAMARQIIKNGGNTFAFFTRNPRGGKAKAIDETDIQNFLVLAQENHFGKIVAHAPYTLNACAAKEELRTFARETFADDLRRMEYTPGNYYNFHPGSHVGQQNGSARNGKARTSLPRRRSPRSWATYEPEQEMASGMGVLPGRERQTPV